jgi:MraZ protein
MGAGHGMRYFLSTYLNKVDKKGRVSVPAAFRSVLSAGRGDGKVDGAIPVIVFPSLKVRALDACPVSYIDELALALENPETPFAMRDMLETVVFGRSEELYIEPDGRMVLSDRLLGHAGIAENVAFVGMRKFFRIWDPVAFDAQDQDMLDQARAQDLTLSNAIAVARSGKGGVS